ncbi:PepSY domain-containing protein [Pelagibacterium limicola]|uniref:PepSY domain-containing protein n=1 Tax=Pelagibacterium limicola TaxID=2791022 RepID=UPI0018B003F7|nr:hypothetical protein [Pelagibacterium limicola]
MENSPATPPDYAASGGNGPPDHATGAGTPQPASPPPAQDGPGLPQAGNPNQKDLALEAVQTGRAVSFGVVLDQARKTARGDFIDGRLVTVEGVLLYQVLMLLEDGTLEYLYYYANTGNPVVRR